MNPATANRDPRWGYVYIVLAAVLWGVSGSAAKFLFHSGIGPFELTQLRLTLAAVLLFGWLSLRNPSRLRIARRDIGYFALFGALGIAGCQSTYLLAISRIQVAAAILLQYLAPIFIALHAVVFARDRLSPVTLAAMIGALAGCYLVVGAYTIELLQLNRVGIAAGVLSAVTFAWYSIQGEYGMRRYDPWTVLFYALFFAMLTLNIVHPPLRAFLHDYTALQWGWILYIGIAGTLAPFGLYLYGVNFIRSTRASITATLEPIVAAVVSYAFLNEVLTPLQIFGGALVIGAVILLQLKQERDEKAPEVMRARSQKQN
jgi:drug/metabolite transporter (DMT)-like permease